MMNVLLNDALMRLALDIMAHRSDSARQMLGYPTDAQIVAMAKSLRDAMPKEDANHEG